MPRYHYDISISRQKRFIRRFKKVLLLGFFLILIGAAIVGADALKQSLKDTTQVGAPSTTVIRPSIREFDTDYFTFTAPTGWVTVPAETTTQKFVYRSYRGTLVEQELIVYYGSAGAEVSGTRALPVRIDAQNHIIPTDVSEHCSTASPVKTATGPVSVSIQTTTILCQLDGTNYVVVVGEKGGNSTIKLLRPDGSYGRYTFVYRSSTIPPDSLPLVNILNSFAAR